MSKFKIGDKVRILDGSKIENYTASWAMGQYVGEAHKVKGIDAHWTDGRVSYMLDDCGCYNFDERGLELVTEQKHKFKVGDKVIGNEKADCYGIATKGWIGTVTEVFDEPRCGGDDFKAIGPGIGGCKATFTLNSNYFDLYTNTQKIVITTDGKTTTAVLYDGKKRIKDAKAVCAPTDTFDFNYGASLALDRLTGFAHGGQVDQTLVEKSDWDRFIAGEIVFEMTSDKFDAFLKEAEERFPELRWCGGEKPTEWKPSYRSSCYFTVDYNGRLCWGTSTSTKKVQWPGKPSFDWKKFAAGELYAKVNKEKYEEFMKLCEEKNFKWADGVSATKMNPWEIYDRMPTFLKMLINATNDAPDKYIYVSFANDEDQLKWNNKPDKGCDIYEFV